LLSLQTALRWPSFFDELIVQRRQAKVAGAQATTEALVVVDRPQSNWQVA
jgi:hypothetical protein